MPGKARNLRGNTIDRWNRRQWIIKTFGTLDPSGKISLVCHHCRRPLYKKWHIDRFPICGHKGGRYTRDNIVPACVKCNANRCKYPGCFKTYSLP